jgi:hypothetical protein
VLLELDVFAGFDILPHSNAIDVNDLDVCVPKQDT